MSGERRRLNVSDNFSDDKMRMMMMVFYTQEKMMFCFWEIKNEAYKKERKRGHGRDEHKKMQMKDMKIGAGEERKKQKRKKHRTQN